jgi:DNA modification methylase
MNANSPIGQMLNQIYQADCLDFMKNIPDESIDMILCDLPYGITQNNWDCYISLEDLWAEYSRIIKNSGVIALTSQGIFTARLIMSQPKLFKYKWIWEKSKPTNFLNAKKQPLRKYEEVCIFYKKQPPYHPQKTLGTPYNKGIRKNQQSGSYGDFKPSHVQSDGERYPTDIIYFKTAESEGEVVHPTQKPVELGRYLVRTYTEPGDIVLDNTCGSGSFLVSALLEGRNFIGIEKNEDVALFKNKPVDYIEISRQRVLKAWSELSDDLKKNIVRSNLFISKTEKMEELSEDVFVIDNEREININVFKKATI